MCMSKIIWVSKLTNDVINLMKMACMWWVGFHDTKKLDWHWHWRSIHAPTTWQAWNTFGSPTTLTYFHIRRCSCLSIFSSSSLFFRYTVKRISSRTFRGSPSFELLYTSAMPQINQRMYRTYRWTDMINICIWSGKVTTVTMVTTRGWVVEYIIRSVADRKYHFSSNNNPIFQHQQVLHLSIYILIILSWITNSPTTTYSPTLQDVHNGNVTILATFHSWIRLSALSSLNSWRILHGHWRHPRHRCNLNHIFGLVFNLHYITESIQDFPIRSAATRPS